MIASLSDFELYRLGSDIAGANRPLNGKYKPNQAYYQEGPLQITLGTVEMSSNETRVSLVQDYRDSMYFSPLEVMSSFPSSSRSGIIRISVSSLSKWFLLPCPVLLTRNHRRYQCELSETTSTHRVKSKPLYVREQEFDVRYVSEETNPNLKLLPPSLTLFGILIY